MGMDVVGRKPRNESGTYFRNNVWWWHPLWEYCENVAPEICEGVLGHSNDGDGLPGEGARKLAEILRKEIESGCTEKYATEHRRTREALPRETCSHCEGTGTRGDAVAIELHMPERILSAEQSERLGRTHGWCNVCGGEGTRPDWAASYLFDVTNVEEFTEFLENCGGFRIH